MTIRKKYEGDINEKNYVWISLLLVITMFVMSGVGIAQDDFIEENIKGEAVKENGDSLVVGMDFADLVSEYIVYVKEYTQFLLEEAGAEVTVTNSTQDVQKQASHIEDYIQKDVDVVVLHSADSHSSVPYVKKLNEAGIPVICLVKTIENEDVKKDLFVTTSDNVRTGEKAAEWLVEKANGDEVEIATFQGNMGASDAYLRAEEIENVVKENPNIKLNQVPCEWMPEKAMSGLNDVLTSNPNLFGMITHCDSMTPGIHSALKQNNRDVPTGEEGHIYWAGIDAAPSGLDMIRKGIMDVAIEQSPLSIATVVAKGIITRVSKGLPLGERNVDMPTTKVTKENVDDPTRWGNFEVEKEELWPGTEKIWNDLLNY